MGELARQPGCPEVATTALELLEPRPGDLYLPNVINRWAWPVSGGLLGFSAALSRNWIYRRPLWAGIQFHIMLTAVMAGSMIFIRDIRYAAAAESEEVYKHYITLHPEDFPPFERKRYRDVYQRFYPVR